MLNRSFEKLRVVKTQHAVGHFDVEEAAIVCISRITSYNVCYTKLLRSYPPPSSLLLLVLVILYETGRLDPNLIRGDVF